MIAPVDVTGIRIETERLILRPWKETDVEDFYEYARVDGVGQRCGWLPHKSIEESRMILGMFIQEKKTFALELKDSGKVIGSIGLEMRDADLGIDENLQGREIGYVLNKDYWGLGLMPEAVKAVIDHCFKELDFDWLTCGHFVWNDQSRRVCEKCGFQYIKDVIHHTRFGTEEPTKLYILENKNKIIRRMSAPIDAVSITLETERLFLRPINQNDLSDIHEIVSDPEVAATAGFPISKTIEDSVKRMLEYMDDNETLAVVLKENNKMIGTVSLQKRHWPMYPINRKLQGRELGFDLNRKYWGRGLMPEAVRAVADYCFQKLGYDFLTAGYFLGNTKSERAIEKCGFEFLFEAEHENPGHWKKMIRTHIQYNPHNKEI